MGIFAGFIIFLVVIGIIGLAVLFYYAEKKRREAMMQVALKLGLNYLEQDCDYENSEYLYNNIKLFNAGHSRKAYNVIGGKKENCNVNIFDYKYVTGSGKNRQTHYYSVCILMVPQRFKSLYVRRENIFDKIAGAIGFDDIDFESKEFSKRYYVKATDKKFAYDIIHPQMMEFLLQSPKVPVVEIDGQHLVFYVNKKIKPESYITLYYFANEFYKKTPDYVLDEYKL